MLVEKVLCMKGGDGATSYASNSLLQETVISKVRPVLEETIKDMFRNSSIPSCFKLVDLGCSSGPNALSVISEIMESIYQQCQQKNCKLPEFQIFLNDLPGNDFNNIFKSLPDFYQSLMEEKGEVFKKKCFISGLPGSFYGRLSPSKSLHFVHSSYSVHWLSKVPEGLVNNKGNIYMAKTSPPEVFKAYLNQFKIDFTKLLSSRSEEMIPGGRLVLTFIGRSIEDPTSKDCCYLWELLTKSLYDLIDEGLVKETDVDSFNLPYYTPYTEEVREIVEMEGSFKIDELQTFQVNWDPKDDGSDKEFTFNINYESGKNVASCIRAVSEPLLSSHFGDHIINALFERYAVHVAEHLSKEKTKVVNIVLAMTKKKLYI